jgi:hypothetical protein
VLAISALRHIPLIHGPEVHRNFAAARAHITS